MVATDGGSLTGATLTGVTITGATISGLSITGATLADPATIKGGTLTLTAPGTPLKLTITASPTQCNSDNSVCTYTFFVPGQATCDVKLDFGSALVAAPTTDTSPAIFSHFKLQAVVTPGNGQLQNNPPALSIVDVARPVGAKVIYLSQPTALTLTGTANSGSDLINLKSLGSSISDNR